MLPLVLNVKPEQFLKQVLPRVLNVNQVRFLKQVTLLALNVLLDKRLLPDHLAVPIVMEVIQDTILTELSVHLVILAILVPLDPLLKLFVPQVHSHQLFLHHVPVVLQDPHVLRMDYLLQ